MCKPLFDDVLELHRSAQVPHAPKRDKSLHALSGRLYKFEQFARKINSGVRDDASAKALLVAYIMGTRAVKQRQAATFAQMDISLEADEQFYKGLWDILCKHYAPESAIISELPLLGDREIYGLVNDPDVLNFNIQTICDDYVNFCIFNDHPEKMRTRVDRMLNLPAGWAARHNLMSAKDNRPYPIDKLLRFMFGLFRADYLCKPAPRDTYWNEYAYLTWQRLHYMLIDDFERAEKVHKEYIKEDTGVDKKPRKNGRKGLGIIV